MEFDKLSTTNGKVTPVGGKSNSGFSADATKMGEAALLPQAKGMLQGLFKAYGLQFPEINMADPKLKDKVVAVGKIAEIAKTNRTALHQLLKHVKTLMDGQVQLAEFYANATAITVDGKKKIDRATAAAFLSLMDYGKHSAALADKVTRSVKALDAKYELIGQLGEGKLATSLKLIESQKQAGEKRQAITEDLQAKRQEILQSNQTRRQKEKEVIRYGHLATK